MVKRPNFYQIEDDDAALYEAQRLDAEARDDAEQRHRLRAMSRDDLEQIVGEVAALLDSVSLTCNIAPLGCDECGIVERMTELIESYRSPPAQPRQVGWAVETTTQGMGDQANDE